MITRARFLNTPKDAKNSKDTKIKKKRTCVYTDISQIDDYIFIGNKKIARDQKQLKKYKINWVINCAKELEYIVDEYDNNIHWLWLPMVDSVHTGNIVPYIPKAIKFIDEAIHNGCKILIHCAAGISRSSSIAIAYLMHKHNLRYTRAFNRVIKKRPCCKPNSKFVKQLKEFIL